MIIVKIHADDARTSDVVVSFSARTLSSSSESSLSPSTSPTSRTISGALTGPILLCIIISIKLYVLTEYTPRIQRLIGVHYLWIRSSILGVVDARRSLCQCCA